MLDRPFRVTRIGPVSYFVDDVERSIRFYTDMLGMSVTERASCRGGECVFLRNGTDITVSLFIPSGFAGNLVSAWRTVILLLACSSEATTSCGAPAYSWPSEGGGRPWTYPRNYIPD
jgi:catechol 2,3-dioxygenase-like lactoylglutathione lyase family enzyme